jgi:hypothetical protein
MSEPAEQRDDLLTARLRVPKHVVYREFPVETVLLNLETGLYHGVNPTGGTILAQLERSEDVRSAAALLAAEYGRPVENVERDVHAFCTALLERGLIEVATGSKA